MRGTWVVATVAAGVLGAVGTVPPGSGNVADLDDLRGVAHESVSVDGTVLGASRQGGVLVTEHDQTCLYELDGSLDQCFDVAIPAGEPVAFSPDGTMIAFGNMRTTLITVSTDNPGLSLLDVQTGEVRALGAELTAPGTDAVTFDAFPAWRNDEQVNFLHHDFDAEQTRHVTAPLDGTADAAPVDLNFLSVGSVGVVGDELIVVLQRRDRSTVVTVGAEPSTVLEFDGDRGAVAGISADRRVAAVTTSNTTTFQPGPVAVLTAGTDERTMSEFDAFTATLDPSGSLVAAVVPSDANASLLDVELLVWDHAANDSVVVDVAAEIPVSMVWTDDDRIGLFTFTSWSVIELER